MSRLHKGSVEYSEYTPTDKDLEQACLFTYEHEAKNKKINGLEYFSSYHYNSRLDADVYINDKYLVVAFAGSETPRDYWQDWKMWRRGELPVQMQDADRLWNWLQRKEMFGDREAIATGYSLGASTAVYIGNKYGDRTVAFCPYGIGNIVNIRNNTDNITNYGNPNDPVFMENYSWHIGKKKFVFNADNFDNRYKYSHYNNVLKKADAFMNRFHTLEKYGNIDFATDDITGQEFLNKVHRTYGGSIESAIEKYTQNSYKDIMQNSSNCPGYVDVKSYTRNGKEVNGYRHDCPYH